MLYTVLVEKKKMIQLVKDAFLSVLMKISFVCNGLSELGYGSDSWLGDNVI